MATRHIRKVPASITRQLPLESDSDDDLFLPAGHRKIHNHNFQVEGRHSISCVPDTHDGGSDSNCAGAPIQVWGFPKSGFDETPHKNDFVRAHSLPTPQGKEEKTQVQTHRRHRARNDSGSSIIDGLLFEIYDRWHRPPRDSFDSDTTFTETSSTSEVFGRGDSMHLHYDNPYSARLHRAFLENNGRLAYLCFFLA